MALLIQASDAGGVNAVGGKAAALSRLAAMGFAPPEFFVIPAAAFRGTPDNVNEMPGLAEELALALDALGPGPFAVRSSGRGEDGVRHSHAGQFDSFLNVAASEVIAAAKKVWVSGASDRAAIYRDATMAEEIGSAPAIVVQNMVAARAAGVVFSADPVSGRRDRIIISAIDGLGDNLVSGESDGEDWVLTRDGAVIEAPDPAKVLNAANARAVAALALRVEEAFGVAQDIEWAFEGDVLYILQARPITTRLRREPAPDSARLIFDNSNIIESYPGLVSPLTYSFAQYVYARVYRAFVRLLGVSEDDIAGNAAVFDNMLGRIDGRVFYNLINWYRALALLPGFSLNRGYMETMMGLSQPMPAEVTATIGPPPATGLHKAQEYLRVGSVAVQLLWQALRLPRTRQKFYARLNDALGGRSGSTRNGAELEKACLTDLAREYRKIERQLLDRWDAPLVNDFFCMIAFGASRNLMQKWLGEPGLRLHSDVMIGQGDIVSAEPARRIAEMGRMVADAGVSEALRRDGLVVLDPHPDIRREVDAYLARFGDRCTQELKLESVPLTDDPAVLLRAISASADRAAPPISYAAEPDWAALFKGRPLRRRIARWAVDWTKARVRDRENLRFERTRVFGHARRVFRAISQQFVAHDKLDAERDIFFLTVNEVLGAIEGFALSQDLKTLVALRKAEDAASGTHPAPPERIDGQGAAVNLEIGAAPGPAVPPTGLQQSGTGCSAGTVTAVARVIHDPGSESLAAGEILVARHTDPGWIAVFANASAIVVERGSLLSHSAIVARELSIPCVVGLKGATDWIADGETIEVDGARGIVRKCNG